MNMLMNEKIKASEVELTGLNGENLGTMTTKAALALAKQYKADLVCTNLLSSPPPCQLMAKGMAKQTKNIEKSAASPKKVKEIRLTPYIEDHDYDTKIRQCVSLLQSGHPVALIVKIQGKEGIAAKALLERMLITLKADGTKQAGIHVSGKQASVTVLPK
ncbi:MAG: translation initiation factor IF-3 [Candidatus Pristimantibacillus lignocellulolyticus]|uniref:Translation initiation factor IF-3 n=1 Tax=Candidatus Pristimantibacillus lignocellulolyticus TaxID=2994561 RepID=A0A9J6ZF27_9BACL|nr:MAG: translation initiation factor IF-3 [Candidatus Pristimantibacillus lignocellulolyticus]